MTVLWRIAPHSQTWQWPQWARPLSTESSCSSVQAKTIQIPIMQGHFYRHSSVTLGHFYAGFGPDLVHTLTCLHTWMHS